MKIIAWYYDARDPEVGKFWNGKEYSQVKTLEEIGLAPLYDASTGELIPDYKRPAAAMQHPKDWNETELRGDARVREEAVDEGRLFVPTKAKKNLGCLTFVVLAAALSIFGSFTSRDGSKADAQYACQEFVKKRLIAPSSAEFGRTTTVQQDNVFKVTSVVDAENAFGAPMRNTWTCRVIWNASDDNFALDLLEHR
ncbi:hypothetical protein [Arthrobacter sp. zg-Y844]|uniref:hypothetical protein n=1 Tax=Arthrobacter sp. zg-Y844 TaxID=2964612 RepID=UPI00210209D9|nr:hypothetical protein [Arthrobacter sp. zg-Y844]MCQ1988050.1 hypothetical protein [Arthrobacter sp. zg-Y844]